MLAVCTTPLRVYEELSVTTWNVEVGGSFASHSVFSFDDTWNTESVNDFGDSLLVSLSTATIASSTHAFFYFCRAKKEFQGQKDSPDLL